MRKTIFVAGTVLLAATGLLFLAGCRNAASPPANDTRGTMVLTIGEEVIGRAILPDIELSHFEQFRLDFTPVTTGPVMNAFNDVWDGNTSGTIQLDVGTWNLRVTAFLETATELPGLTGLTPEQALAAAAAVGAGVMTIPSDPPGDPPTITQDIVVPPGGTVNVTVDLDPIVEGQGIFSWNITFAANAGIATAIMDITVGPTPDTGIDIYTRRVSQETLGAGLYTVVITLTNDELPPETVRIPQYLRVYQNLESHLNMAFSNLHFPVTLLRYILRSWTGTAWDFTGRGISYLHFNTVGINGVNAGNFAAVNTQMNVITLASGPPPVIPTDLATLGHLVDTALIAIAIAGSPTTIDPADFDEVEEVAYELSTFAANTAALGITITYDDTIYVDLVPYVRMTVTIGAYQTVWNFRRLGGDVVITYAPPPLNSHHRVGDLLTANIANLDGAGAPIFQWVRSAASYPAYPADPENLVNAGGVGISGATSATYLLNADDINRHIAVEVRRVGYFGRVISDNMIGPIVHPPVDTTITIQLTGFNGINFALPGGTISLYTDPSTPPTLTVSPRISGESITLANVRWFAGWNPSQLTGIGVGTDLTLSTVVHNDRIGVHHLTVKAEIGGRSYSRVITFTVDP